MYFNNAYQSHQSQNYSKIKAIRKAIIGDKKTVMKLFEVILAVHKKNLT
jgi:hypothetical protein